MIDDYQCLAATEKSIENSIKLPEFLDTVDTVDTIVTAHHIPESLYYQLHSKTQEGIQRAYDEIKKELDVASAKGMTRLILFFTKHKKLGNIAFDFDVKIDDENIASCILDKFARKRIMNKLQDDGIMVKKYDAFTRTSTSSGRRVGKLFDMRWDKKYKPKSCLLM